MSQVNQGTLQRQVVAGMVLSHLPPYYSVVRFRSALNLSAFPSAPVTSCITLVNHTAADGVYEFFFSWSRFLDNCSRLLRL